MSVITGAESPVGTPLSLFLIQLILVVVCCRVLSHLFKYIKQPSVIAEVVTGIVLGPSVFGYIPGFTDAIFPPASLPIFNVIANVGLILFMFMVGLEIDTKLMKKNVGGSILISLTAMITPFLLGLGSSYVIYQNAVDKSVSYTSFLLFVAVAMSITAFPVLARILTELKLLESKIGNLALSSAAVDDVIAWCVLALVVAIARAHGGIEALWTFLLLITFFAFMMLVIRPLLASVAKRRFIHNGRLSLNMVVILLVSIFVCAWITETIGVHAIFGSFILGVVVPRRNGFAAAMIERIEDLVVIIFLPLYFTFSGLRTSIGSLSHGPDWGLVVLVIVTACVGKILGATLATKVLHNTWRDSFAVGLLMNTKGLVELIVLNVGLDVGVLNTRVFTIFVIMALVTTFMTTPLLHFFYLRKKGAQKDQTTEGYSVFIGLQNLKAASWMVRVSNMFTNGKENVLIKALLLTEITDRPSSYFFSEYYNMVQETPMGKKRKVLLSDLKHNLKTDVGAVQTKTIASANLAKDVANYCETHPCDILLFELHYEKVQVQSANKLNLRTSMSSFSNYVDHKMESVMKYDPSSKIISAVVDSTHCTVGVLVHREEKSTDISRVLFLYNGSPSEQRALKVASRLPESYSVTILAKNQEYGSVEDTRMIYVPSAAPLMDVVEEAKKGYDLIMVGAPRGSSVIYESDVMKTDLPVLLIYPDLQTADRTSIESKHSDELHVDLP